MATVELHIGLERACEISPRRHPPSERKGLGVMVVLHDVNMAARFCDEIIAVAPDPCV